MYTKVEEAIHFMVKAYKGQKRKNENIDISFHSMIVGMMIRNITYSEDVIVAAILHDIINDSTYGYEDIEEMFGTLVADIVYDLSENMSIPKWLDRKRDFLNRIKKNYDLNVINIMIADKIQNLVADYELFLDVGDKVWKSSGGSKDENMWLYRESYYIAKEKGADQSLLDRYKKLLIIYFGDVDE
ncbi:MAG: HD domain-containing protein [Bacilli bacterium]|nr:HD domain-containing protein [Bacilli bacterium]